MARGCFILRGWESNVPGHYIFRSSGVTSLLGLLWDLNQDTLKCNLNYSGEENFSEWRDEIVYLEKDNIPRYVEITENSELHLFVDACKSSYGACVYIQTVSPLGVKIRLIRAKSRVAPLKTMTIPRLELMACCIGARLVHSVYAALDIPDLKIFAWSDSMVALWWLKNHGDWSVFVANRVNEINSLVPSQIWRHVPGELNPADFLSRGISPRLFSDSLWWEGPSWLLEPPSNWPIDRLACETSEVEREKRKVSLCNLVAVEGEIPWYAFKFSNFQSIIRFVSWMLRFVENVKKKRGFREIGDLTIHEIEHAEKTLIKIVQAKFFPSENSFPNMNVITDEEGIKRVKTRITERSDHPEFIYPIILPGECLFTQRLIEYYHRQNCHAGTQILLGILRERFWIVRSRRVVRKIVRSCIRCKRYKCKSPNSEPVSLPGDRVNDAAVAVHLELTSSLSTDAFLLSLRRFIARRGRPRVIYSDNGTNFRGAHGELSGIDWEKVLKLATIQRIIWKFNPPTAAWWGGWWERLVRVLKELLRRTLGNAILTTEELQTVLCDCESVINSRPLTYLSENSDDLVPLSPAMFLVENRNLDVPDIDYRDTVNLRKRGPLSEVRLGEIVLIGDDIKKRMHWPLAKVIRLIPGKDGKIRTEELKTRTGTIDNLSDPNDSSNVLPRVSKYGRVIKYQRNWTSSTRCYMFLSPSDVDSKKGEDVEGHHNKLFR
ncbi:integrase catalytic domain-containing protein [Trichonephila clavipes]|nr:integrase catalytic domain-containing protein [Trichonephila clavipes]